MRIRGLGFKIPSLEIRLPTSTYRDESAHQLGDLAALALRCD